MQANAHRTPATKKNNLTVNKSSVKNKFDTPSTQAASGVKNGTVTQPRTFKEGKNLFDDPGTEKQSRRSSAMKTSQRSNKKRRSRFPEQTFNLPEDIGPGTYDATAAKDALGPRT